MFGAIGESLGVPLHGCEEGEGWVFEALDDAVGGGGDDLQAAAELVGGLFVIAVGLDLWLADGAAKRGVHVDVDGMFGRGLIGVEAAVLDSALAREIGEKLVEAAAAVDIHELAAEADAEGGEFAFFDFGDEGKLKILSRFIHADGLEVPLFAVVGGVHVVAADEEDSIEGIDDLGDEGMVGVKGDRQGEPAGFFDG